MNIKENHFKILTLLLSLMPIGQYFFNFKCNEGPLSLISFIYFLLPFLLISHLVLPCSDYLSRLSFHTILFIRALLGVSFASLVFNIFGQFGFPLNQISIASIILILVVLSSKTFFKEKIAYSPYTSRSLLLIPFIILMVFIIYFALKINNALWDHFTFWWINPKEIYLDKYFDFSEEKYPIHILYSSFHTMPLVLMYNFFGGVVERLGSFFTIMYLFAGIFLVFDLAKDSAIEKLLFIIIFLVAYIFSRPRYLYAYYAEIYVTTLIALFVYFLSFQKKLNLNILLYLVFIISAVKPTNKYYALMLLLAIGFKIIIENKFHKKIIFHKKVNYFLLLIVPLFFFSRKYYLNYLMLNVSDTRDILVLNIEPTVTVISNKILELTVFLFNMYPILLPLAVLIVLCSLFNLRKKHQLYVMLFIALSLPALNVFHFLITDFRLASKSLARYVSTTFLVFPMLLVLIQTKKYLIVPCILTSLCFLIPSCYNYLEENVNYYSGRKYHNGLFRNRFKKFADSARENLQPNDRVAIYRSRNEQFINGTHLGNVLHYELLDFDIDKGIVRAGKSEFLNRLKKTRPDKVLIVDATSEDTELLKGMGLKVSYVEPKYTIFSTPYDKDG